MSALRGMIAGAVALAAASPALAQHASPVPTLGGVERADGARLGAFLFRPSIGVGSEYNDNYLLEEDGEAVSTFIFRVAPEASLRSNWSRHALSFTIGGEAGFFTEDSSDDYLDYNAGARLVLDVTRRITLTGDLGFSHEHEQRGDDNSPLPDGSIPNGAVEPVEFDRLTAGLRADFRGGSMRFSPSVAFTNLDYDDVALVTGSSNQDDRDRDEFVYGAEIGYQFLRGYEAFVRGEYIDVTYATLDDELDDDGDNITRDNQGFRALGGVNVAVTRLIDARLGAGYFSREYDDDFLPNAQGFTIDVGAIWSPTPLTTVRVSGARDVDETTVDSASGRIRLAGRFAIDHALRQNLILSAFAAAATEEFEGIDRNDDNLQFGLGAEWLITRSFSASARYQYEDETSSGVDDGVTYDVNQFFIGLSARY